MKRAIFLILYIILIFSVKSQNLISEASIYICPPCDSMCDDLEHSKPGFCSYCNMRLINKGSQKTIAFYLQNGVEVLDFAGPMEVFSYAGYKVFTVSKTKEPIKSQGILTIISDYSIADAPAADILAFFGGNSGTASGDPEVIEWVRDQEEVEYHFSVCTGAFILAEAGVLKGKTATTFHSALDNLKENYPETDVRYDVRFVDNGNVITTAGISAGIDGALHLVTKLQGMNVAKRTAYYMEYDNWMPGNGLILSADNPYQQIISANTLMDYVGKYEHKGGLAIDLIVDKNELTAMIEGRKFPLYYEDQNLFTDIDGEPIFFKRGEKNNVVGYCLVENGEVYRKIE